MRNNNPGRIVFSYFAARFGSKSARFKSAVAIGFVVSIVGFFAAGPGARPSFADDSIWGAMSTLFGAPSASLDHGMAAPSSYSRRYRPISRSTQRRATVRPMLAADAAPNSVGRTMCVRLCDGYAFPVGPYHGKSDTAAHQLICQASCPDAKTALYVLPNGSDEIGKGIDLVSGRNYSELPDAFHYATVLDEACTCHRDGVDGKALSLLRDFTLRRGDAVMTAGGIRVFHGSMRFPYRRGDFVALTRSRDVRGADRAAMKAIERASLNAIPAKTAPVVAQHSLPSARPDVPDLATVVVPVEPPDRG